MESLSKLKIFRIGSMGESNKPIIKLIKKNNCKNTFKTSFQEREKVSFD